jgi:hypothetical protein
MEGLDQVSEEFSFEKEKEIARSFSKRFPMGNDVNWCRARQPIWLSLWPLVIYGYISLGFWIFFGSLLCMFCIPSISRSTTWQFFKRKSKEKMDRFFCKSLHINNHNVSLMI